MDHASFSFPSFLDFSALRSYQHGAAPSVRGEGGCCPSFLRFLFQGVLLLLPSLCFADDLWITASTVSHHFNTEEKLNERNPGLGVEYGGRNYRLIGGEYTNSNRRHSTYFGGLYAPVELLNIKLGMIAGMVNGYPINNGRFSPAATLVAIYESHGFGVNMIMTPKITNITPLTLALQLKMKF